MDFFREIWYTSFTRKNKSERMVHMMRKTENLIIGAGISGLSFAASSKDYLIAERESEAGGYCRTIRRGDFVWDFAGHFFHFKTERLKKKFIDSVPSDEFVDRVKKTYIYYKDKLIDYPFQTNIHELDKDEFIDCLYDLFNKEEKESYDNFLDMLYGKFGRSITEKFLKPYNEKLYAVDLAKLDKDAMGRFFPYADVKAIISNMKEQKNASYNSTFLYPRRGAELIIDILKGDVDSDKLLLDTTVTSIDLDSHVAALSNGDTVEYGNLINTAPFNVFLRLTGDARCRELSEKLTYNKVLVFNLGFNKKSPYDSQHWLYFPDKSFNFYRVGFYDNILGADRLSMYIEIGYPKDADVTDADIDEQLRLTLENLARAGIIDDSFVLEEHMSILMDPAYVHIDAEHDREVREIMEELKGRCVYSIGRYGAWTYCSMEDCMLEAEQLSEKLRAEK